MPNAFITGTSSGLGHALARQLLNRGWRVYGCSRRGCQLPGIHHKAFDLTDQATLEGNLEGLLKKTDRLDLVVLNAGILGEIRDLQSTHLDAIRRIMDINVWANKTVMDWLLRQGKPVQQVVMISSGASILGNRGWGGYALSKATLNMLARLYAQEAPDTHISALAPGIIDTAMMQHLCEEADSVAFPALQRLREARGTNAMPDADGAAARVLEVLPALRERTSGDFIDIREILDPEGHAALYGKR